MQEIGSMLDRVLQDQPAWYRGDFHCHTCFSDGVLTPQELLAVGRSEGLDFFAVTDHNRVDAYAGFGCPDDVCVIPGIEVTFDRGHFNVFGTDRAFPWLDEVCSGPLEIRQDDHSQRLSDLVTAAAVGGLLTSINHPLLPPWAWLDGATRLADLLCLEIWNDPSWPSNRQANPRAVEMWTAWLNAGHRVTGIGGSDYHRPVVKPGETKPPERLGLPSTYVYAENLSGAAILDGVRRGRVYVSMGPQVTFTAQGGDDAYAIGDTIAGIVDEEIDLDASSAMRGRTRSIEFSATVTGVQRPGIVRIVRNGVPVIEEEISGDLLALRWTETLVLGQPNWYRLDVYDTDGLISAITNPIYAGAPAQAAQQLYGDFEAARQLAGQA